MRSPLLFAIVVTSGFPLHAQTASPEFDVVSIKRVDELRQGGGVRTEPDGTVIVTNQPLGALIGAASPVPILLRDVVGVPDWMMQERYDVTAKPPPGLTREQLREQMPAMWRTMFADRMRLAAHVEQRERDVYRLVMARSDRKFGPDLKPSTLDCTALSLGTSLPPAPQGPPSLPERQNRCGLSVSPGLIVSGGVTMDRFVPSLSGLAGGTVENHTGLDGRYALMLRFSMNRQAVAVNPTNNDDAPDFFTALEEQLGLRLQRDKKPMPVFVIDHVERPSAN